jgi:hypothetical protein
LTERRPVELGAEALVLEVLVVPLDLLLQLLAGAPDLATLGLQQVDAEVPVVLVVLHELLPLHGLVAPGLLLELRREKDAKGQVVLVELLDLLQQLQVGAAPLVLRDLLHQHVLVDPGLLQVDAEVPVVLVVLHDLLPQLDLVARCLLLELRKAIDAEGQVVPVVLLELPLQLQIGAALLVLHDLLLRRDLVGPGLLLELRKVEVDAKGQVVQIELLDLRLQLQMGAPLAVALGLRLGSEGLHCDEDPALLFLGKVRVQPDARVRRFGRQTRRAL